MTAARVATVTNTVQRPGTASPVKGLSVTIRLNVLGFIDGGSTEKVNTRFVETDDDGVWSCELEANTDIDPAGTYYTVHEGKIATWSIVVPPAGSPVNLRDILVDDPANPSPMVAGVPLPGSGVPAGDVWITDGLGGGDYAPPAGGGGDVQTVAGVSPDGAGDVPLTAADVGAATASALTAEATTRASADTTLAGLITGEAATARAAESANATAIAAEATTRGSADTANATAIANEVTRATGVEAVKADLVAGKVPTSQLPALAINEVFPVASQAAMLALTAQRGDIARRTDFTPNHLFLLTTDSPSTLGDWLLIVSDPGAGVDTVNGQSGTVVLAAADVGADTAVARDSAIANQHTTDVSLFQPADPDLTTIAGLDATTAGALVTDGAGWIRKTYAQLKTALGLVKADVGLGSVDNTADSAKPVSTAQSAADATVLSNAQTYADGKVIDSIADADTSHAPSRNAVFDALALKAPLASPTFTGTVTVPTPINPTDVSTKQYVDNAVTGLLDFRGSYDASVNTFPAAGGSGTAGAVLKGDVWIASVGGTLGGVTVTAGDLIVALVDTPGQTAANWDLVPHDGAYVTLTGNQTVAGTKTFSTSPVVPTPAAADNSTKAASTAYVDAADALAILKSIGTTKGDQIGFTGSGAPVRHAIGADGTVQTADSTQADGWKWAAAVSGGAAIYGDSSDGTVTFDGATTVLGMAPASSTYTLTRDLFLAAGTINNGVSIITNGYRIFCAGTLTNNGTIKWDGIAGSGSTAAGRLNNALSTFNSGTGTGVGAGSGGGTSSNTVGTAGTSQNGALSLGGAGGAGGSGAGGAGGAGGTVTAVAAGYTYRTVVAALGMGTYGGANNAGLGWVPINGGAGAGQGGGTGATWGGAGGGGGGVVVVVARIITGTGSIRARGGAGSVAINNNSGGGGGGGGGAVLIVSSSISAGAITGQTIDANGGAAGAGLGTGTAGVAGSSGTVVMIPN